MFESLVENAIDFMKVSLRELESSPKYSVINFCSAVEIFFKARLMAEHWSLVVAKPETATLSKFKEGEFKSVTLDQAISRLENIAGEKFSKNSKTTFTTIREHRNKLIHFFHPEYVTSKNEQIKTQIVSEQCQAWLHLHRLLTSQWKEHFSNFSVHVEKLDKLMYKHRAFLEVKYKSLKPELKQLMKEGKKIVKCSACGFAAAQQTEDPPPIKDIVCLVCKARDRYLNMPCPVCDEGQVYDGNIIECAKCKQIITEDDIIEKFTPEEFQAPPNEPCEDLLAYCYYCEHINPSVVKLSNEWVCLACLEPHDEPGNCDWCNEFITGDLEGSGYYGCPHCEGSNARNRDD